MILFDWITVYVVPALRIESNMNEYSPVSLILQIQENLEDILEGRLMTVTWT